MVYLYFVYYHILVPGPCVLYHSGFLLVFHILYSATRVLCRDQRVGYPTRTWKVFWYPIRTQLVFKIISVNWCKFDIVLCFHFVNCFLVPEYPGHIIVVYLYFIFCILALLYLHHIKVTYVVFDILSTTTTNYCTTCWKIFPLAKLSWWWLVNTRNSFGPPSFIVKCDQVLHFQGNFKIKISWITPTCAGRDEGFSFASCSKYWIGRTPPKNSETTQFMIQDFWITLFGSWVV